MYGHEEERAPKKKKSLKPFIALILVVVIALGSLMLYMMTHVNVKPGEVGYMYDRRLKPGDERSIPGTSVINQELYGRVKINPIYQELYTYPTTIQARSWTSNSEGDANKDEAFVLGTKEGQNINADIYLSVRPKNAGKIIAAFGKKHFSKIIDEDLYGLAKGKASIITQDVSVYDVQNKRGDLQRKTFELLDAELEETYGIDLVRFEIGNLDLPDDIQSKINQKTEAVNAVELARLDRQKQDELNQKIVDQQKAESEKELIKRQFDADAKAYEVTRAAEAKELAAKALLQAAKLEKEAELEKQKAYTEDYFRDKSLEVYREAAAKINPTVKTIITDSQGSGFEGLFGIKEILKTME